MIFFLIKQIAQLSYIMVGGNLMQLSDSFFDKIKKKTNVDKDTLISLAGKLNEGNMKDPDVLKDIIGSLSRITGKEISKEREEKIINTIVNDEVPTGKIENMFEKNS